MISFQDVILKLQTFWAAQGCVILQSYDLEMGAGTSHPLTALYALGPKPWRASFVQPCRRPQDGRYGDNPNRLQKFLQYQVILKPAPTNIQNLLLKSYEEIGINTAKHDIRFVEDDWENPSLGAAGLGWEVWLNGMEITQFTYFQQMGGTNCSVVPVELAYGLERICMHIQEKENIFDLCWNKPGTEHSLTYGDINLKAEREFSVWYFEKAPIVQLEKHFEEALSCGEDLVKSNLILPAYDQCIQAGHLFNILEARGSIGVLQRALALKRIRHLAEQCCGQWEKTL